MGRTKRGKTRQPNPLKPAPPKQLGQVATTMRVVATPVLGHFYSIDTVDDVIAIYLFSGKKERRVDQFYWEAPEPVVLVDIPVGSMIYYLGKHHLSQLQGTYHKIGYGEYFGYIPTENAIFYELGE